MYYDDDTDDLGYSKRDKYFCTDPTCDGQFCNGDNHITQERLDQQNL